MIAAMVLYTLIMALGTCIARAHGLIPENGTPVILVAPEDTTETEEPDTALAITFPKGGKP